MLKKLKYLIAFVPVLFCAQTEFQEYQSASNTFYWKNRKPYEGYWQQDVHYDIKAELNNETDVISGKAQLTYLNNSPDELSYVYFHLYSNAQAKGSYLSDLYKNNNYRLKYGKYRDQGLGTKVSSVKSGGTDLKTELDNTILKVYLPKTLKPGETVVLQLDFETYFDREAIRNRMKLFYNELDKTIKHYDIVHWYPRISVYDRKFGWDTQQHMDHEFYGEFGSFHVEMTLPNNFIMDGTGKLTNESEMLPKELRARLDVSNFKTQWGKVPSIVIPSDGTKKTWKFSAINVHDVAYTTDPSYRIGEVVWNGVRCIALVQENHAAGWQKAAEYVAKIISTNSKLIGMYAYPKMIAADAADGMEYPMLTLDGGYDPEFRSLFTHEISHNWFFGMLGSNETYRAFMDEGFTQFYSAYTWEHIEGKYDLFYPDENKYVARYSKPVPARESEAYTSYYNSVMKGEEVTLNTHSDGFSGGIRHGGGYGQVYAKTATMLYNLKYVLGDSLFDAAIQHYFDQWKICHPYPEDMRNSIISFTKTDLNWFFDQWLETYKTIDYKVKKVKQKKETVEVTLERKGFSMEMPIDFTVYTKDSSYNYHIPNNWFVKKTTATVLPRWIGWDKVKKTYTAKLNIPGKVLNVVIDTSCALADVNYLDNRWKKNVEGNFDSKIWNLPDRTHYELFYKPVIWYNSFDGLKFGLNMNGNYMNTRHIFDATLFVNSGIAQSGLDSTVRINSFDPVSFYATYKTATDKFMKKSAFLANVKVGDGLYSLQTTFEKKSNNERNRFYVSAKSMYRDVNSDRTYLLYKDDWLINKWNNAFHFGLDHNYSYRRGNGQINVNLRSPLIFSDYDFSALSMSCVNKNDLGKININTRFFAQIGTGNSLPSESMLWVYGANPEEMMENKFNRAAGPIPAEWARLGVTTNHFAAGGGLNLRGYGGYLLPFEDKYKNTNYAYKGTSGLAFNTEVEFGELFKVKSRFLRRNFRLVPYLFADAGMINTNYAFQDLKMSEVMADAGIGFAFTIQRWLKLQTAKPFTVRCDLPLFINKLPYAEKDFVQMRWTIGVSRAF